MKTVIFSDTHLGTNFDQKKFDFLKKIINTADRVIINGDFWEGFDMSFDAFVSSPWKKLFPYLLSKKTVYVFGNHDKKHLSNKKLSLFSTYQTKQHKLKIGSKTFIFEHGDRLLPLVDEFFRKYLKMDPPSLLNKSFELFEKFAVKKFGKKYLNIYKSFNNKIKVGIKKDFKNSHYFVFGHTHLAEYDSSNRFINSGFVKHGLGQYIIIDKKGNVTLKEEFYG